VIDWGSVPDWISGIGTTGALLATLHIILSDRERAETQQAQQEQVWRDDVQSSDWPRTGKTIAGMRVRFRNNSSAPISEVGIAMLGPVDRHPEVGRAFSPGTPYGSWPPVGPGEQFVSDYTDFKGQRDGAYQPRVRTARPVVQGLTGDVAAGSLP
jgi:hypothetical protein